MTDEQARAELIIELETAALFLGSDHGRLLSSGERQHVASICERAAAAISAAYREGRQDGLEEAAQIAGQYADDMYNRDGRFIASYIRQRAAAPQETT